MKQTQTKMGNGLYVKESEMTPWGLERVKFMITHGSNAKYEIDEVEN